MIFNEHLVIACWRQQTVMQIFDWVASKNELWLHDVSKCIPFQLLSFVLPLCQDRACSPVIISSAASGVAPSAQYSCDMAPRSAARSDHAPRSATGVTLAQYGTDLDRQNGAAMKAGIRPAPVPKGSIGRLSCDMDPVKLISGFYQHRAKTAVLKQSHEDNLPNKKGWYSLVGNVVFHADVLSTFAHLFQRLNEWKCDR